MARPQAQLVRVKIIFDGDRPAPARRIRHVDLSIFCHGKAWPVPSLAENWLTPLARFRIWYRPVRHAGIFTSRVLPVVAGKVILTLPL